jgi:ribosomal protein L44E
VTIEIEENVDLHHRADMELVCPFCHTHTISTIVNHGTLRIKCSECSMDAFVTRIPRTKKLSEYVSRRLIA